MLVRAAALALLSGLHPWATAAGAQSTAHQGLRRAS